MAQLTKTDSNWNLSLDNNDNEIILETAGTYLDKNIKISVSNNSIPSGVIMLWSGLSSNIPEGYVLCDGNNGTPNLTDKFIIGAGSTYPVGETGGESVHILTIDEMPSHSHNGTTGQNGNHSHKIGTDKDTTYVTYGDCWSVHNSSTGATYYNGSTTSDGNHTHSFTTNNIGGNQAHNNMPPYLAVYMWKRTK